MLTVRCAYYCALNTASLLLVACFAATNAASKKYILRPETVESLYILHQVLLLILLILVLLLVVLQHMLLLLHPSYCTERVLNLMCCELYQHGACVLIVPREALSACNVRAAL
jgi:hypothetical protein